MEHGIEGASRKRFDLGKTLRGLVAAAMVALAPASAAEAVPSNAPEVAGELSQAPKLTPEQQEQVKRMEGFLMGFFENGSEGWKLLTLTPLESVHSEVLEALTGYGADAIEKNEDPIKAFADRNNLSTYFQASHGELMRGDRTAVGISKLLSLISEAAEQGK